MVSFSVKKRRWVTYLMFKYGGKGQLLSAFLLNNLTFKREKLKMRREERPNFLKNKIDSEKDNEVTLKVALNKHVRKIGENAKLGVSISLCCLEKTKA